MEQATGRCDGGKIERDAGEVQIERGFEQGFVFAFAAGRGQDGVLRALSPLGIPGSNGPSAGMRADFQPGVGAEFGDGGDRLGKLHRLAHALRPMFGRAGFTGNLQATDGAEEWNLLRLRRQMSQRFLERVGRGLHHGVMERETRLQEARENSLRLQLRGDDLERRSQTGKRDANAAR